MLSQGQELAAIDFADIIGGPLIAVINAQAKAAHVTTSFIQQIAFAPSTGSTPQTGSSPTATLQTVSFDFSQILGQSSPGGGAAGGGLGQGSTIQVPLLSLLPIPFIRVDSMTINFNVNLQSSSSTTISNDFTFNSTTSENSNGFWFTPSVSFQANVTNQNTYQYNQVVDDTYSLQVTVNAVQDEMPGGMQQILGIFGNLIQAQSTLLQTVMTTQIQAKQAQLTAQPAQSTPGAVTAIPANATST